MSPARGRHTKLHAVDLIFDRRHHSYLGNSVNLHAMETLFGTITSGGVNDRLAFCGTGEKDLLL